MGEMKKQIEELVTMLRGKGYHKHFSIDTGLPVPLQAGLEGYLDMNRINNGDRKVFPLHIRTHAHYRHVYDRVDCIFEINYSEKNGFQIQGMNIRRYRSYNMSPDSKLLFPETWGKVPTADRVNKMMGLEGKQKRKGL